jgi:hypothetical protein
MGSDSAGMSISMGDSAVDSSTSVMRRATTVRPWMRVSASERLMRRMDKRLEDLGDGDEDGTFVLKRREFEGLVFASLLPPAGLVRSVVEA